MKIGKILIITLTLFLATIRLYAQNNVNPTDVALFKIRNNNAGLFLGETMEKAIQILGKPTKIEELFL